MSSDIEIVVLRQEIERLRVLLALVGESVASSEHNQHASLLKATKVMLRMMEGNIPSAMEFVGQLVESLEASSAYRERIVRYATGDISDAE